MEQIPKKKIRVFVVDNDINIVHSISRTIKSRFDDEIDFETYPSKAYDEILLFNPDIIITDVNFNETGVENSELSTAGVVLSRRIRKVLPSVAIIAISGYRNNDYVFDKIIEKDWYDYFHTKGTDDLYEKYSILRDRVINTKTGLIPKLSMFFSPMNYGGDVDFSFYRILHTNYPRNENLELLSGIEDNYNSFKFMLQEDSSKLIDGCFSVYKNRDLTNFERSAIKDYFHLKTSDLKCLNNSPKITIYSEKSVIAGTWEKIISETEDRGNIKPSAFNIEIGDSSIILSAKQDVIFNFPKFIESARSLKFYKQIQYYGDVIISSQDKVFSCVSNNFIRGNEDNIEGSLIRLVLKYTTPS